jgi:endonuclease/exonuclease/phosphatase family metal-dependent hydrolase
VGDGSNVTRVCWVAAGGLAAAVLARAAEVDRLHRTEAYAVPLVALTPQLSAAAPWAAIGLRLARRPGAAVAACAAAAALSVMVRPRRKPRAQPEAGGPVLRVLTMNLYFGQADPDVLVDQVRQLRADVLCLQELTAGAVTRLKQAGLDDLMPYAQHDLRSGSRGSGIYSRFLLSDGPQLPDTHMAQPTALVQLPGGEAVELVCVHPVAPGLRRWGGAARWRHELALLPAPGDRPRVLAGDFNASLDHATFRDVLRLGYHDAAQQAGDALTPTWGLPGGSSGLFALDHVLVDESCAVRGYSVHCVPVSDHRAVFAEIQLPALAAGQGEGVGPAGGT